MFVTPRGRIERVFAIFRVTRAPSSRRVRKITDASHFTCGRRWAPALWVIVGAKMRCRLLVLALAGACVHLAACASFTLVRTTNEPRPASKRPEEVVILGAPPERPHHEVGVFTYNDLRESDASFTKKLIELAAFEGCDVVLAIPGKTGSPSCLMYEIGRAHV